jgi:protein-disulfide isomerase
LGLWLVLFAALAVVLAGCKSTEAEALNQGAAAVDQEAAADGSELAEGQLFTVGFTPDGSPFKGDLDAPVTIEEFSSYQCPFCARYFTETYPDMMSRYVEQGQVL